MWVERSAQAEETRWGSLVHSKKREKVRAAEARSAEGILAHDLHGKEGKDHGVKALRA